MTEHFDVIIVGAGLSGIGAAHQVAQRFPGKTYAILEGRERMGGTWDLFRYPGIRSDSDMFTLGYRFKPWTAQKAIADGGDILAYIEETARECGADRHIRYQHGVRSASWSSEEARWTLEVERGPGKERGRLTCSFLYVCAGYYRYDQGHTPDFAGRADFAGTIIHPQHWPADFDHSGKRIVVIGSGATAVTLIPSLAKTAAHVTMLQRSPTYIVSLPARDKVADWLRTKLPAGVAYDVTRWKNILTSLGLYQFARKQPERTKEFIRTRIERRLGKDYPDLEKHFTPSYQPWDQRVCLVPDADLWKTLKSGKADVVTDRIERFTKKGILLQSGKELEADVIVTATGLSLLFLGGIELTVDGVKKKASELYTYKGMMLSGVPNLALSLGYTNASWTLKADLIAEYVCRLLQKIDETGARYCVPEVSDPTLADEPLLDFSSGYVLRALDILPKQKAERPWKVFQNYALDLFLFRFAKLDDGEMHFVRGGPVASRPLHTAERPSATV
jgi:monooxygenase